MRFCGFAGLSVGLLVIAIAGCKTEYEFVPPPPPEVTVAQPLDDKIVVFREFTGRTAPEERVEIRARVRGFLREIAFQEGELVDANDVLYRIEPEQYEAALQSAQASAKDAEAEVERTQFEFERLKDLYEKQVAAQTEYIDAMTAYKRADAELLAAKANVTQAQLDLDYTTIRAPISGRVNLSVTDVGNLVGPTESDVLTTIVPWDPIYVYFTVSERRVLEFRRQQARTAQNMGDLTVYIRLADGTDYPHTGTIDYADNSLDPDTGTLRVRAIFPNPDSLLVPGIFARVRIPKDAESALLVPEVALQRDLAGYYLMTVGTDNKASRVNVTIGDRAGTYREVIEGLSGDERVIINGLQRVRGGAPVNPTLTQLKPLEISDQMPATTSQPTASHRQPAGTDADDGAESAEEAQPAEASDAPESTPSDAE
jgi:RND family efflux transporter MFP subunit